MTVRCLSEKALPKLGEEPVEGDFLKMDLDGIFRGRIFSDRELPL